MGTWGPGLFDNDHARDLWSVEASHLVKELAAVLAQPGLAFDDIEGPLVYVRLLARMAELHEVSECDRATVEGWRRTYRDAFTRTITGAREGYVDARTRVIDDEFDALLARLPAAEPPARPAKRAATKPRAKTSTKRTATSTSKKPASRR